MVTKNRDHFFCLLTSERWAFRALKMRPVRQETVHSLWSREFCGPLKMRRVPQKPVLRTEYLFRTGKACFLHRMLLKMRRVPEEAFLSTECVFRTVEACFWYGALPKTHRTWLSRAQESEWQLPLRGLSTPGRGRGKSPPETSSALAGRRKWWKGPERTK